MKLKTGNKAPNFISIDQNEEVFDSSKLVGKKWVLYFYPKDLTPTCTIQACNLRDHYLTLQEKGITVIGVSADGIRLHQRFIERHKLPFTLLSDENRNVIEAFGVWGEKKFMGRTFDGIHRSTFVMNEKNEIIGIIEKPKSKIHAQEILTIYQEKEERK